MTAFIIGLVVITFLLCLQMCAVLYQDVKKVQEDQNTLFHSLWSMNKIIDELHDRLRVLEDKTK